MPDPDSNPAQNASQPNADAPGKAHRRFTPSGGKLVVTVVTAACATVVATVPQAVPAGEMPAPVIDDSELAAVEAQDRALAVPAVEGSAADRLRALIAAQGRAEAGEPETAEARDERARALPRVRSLVVHESGDEGAPSRLRAEAMQSLWVALEGGLEDEQERAALGSFPRMLERYGASRDGRLVAPRLVAYAMYKARFNLLIGLESTAGFGEAERRAYWGWAATSARAPEALAHDALLAYREAGGENVDEIAAFAAARQGHAPVAARLFRELYERTGVLRYRNYALGALYLAP